MLIVTELYELILATVKDNHGHLVPLVSIHLPDIFDDFLFLNHPYSVPLLDSGLRRALGHATTKQPSVCV